MISPSRIRITLIGPSNTKFEKLHEALKDSGFDVVSGNTDENLPTVFVLTAKTKLKASQKVNELLETTNPHAGLLTVKLSSIQTPSVLSNTRVLDLSRWRGAAGNAVLQDLINALTYSEFTPVKKKRFMVLRDLIKRWWTGLTVTAVLGASVFFSFNILSLQNNLCSINFAQPRISDFCGSLGLGGKPKKEERIAWGRVSPKSCDALRTHIDTFPAGAFRDDAADILEARETRKEPYWTADTKSLTLFVIQDGDGLSDKKSAQDEAFQRGKSKAKRLCSSFSNTSLYKLISSEPKVGKWSCSAHSSGYICGFEGHAACNLQVKRIKEVEVCGGSTKPSLN